MDSRVLVNRRISHLVLFLVDLNVSGGSKRVFHAGGFEQCWANTSFHGSSPSLLLRSSWRQTEQTLWIRPCSVRAAWTGRSSSRCPTADRSASSSPPSPVKWTFLRRWTWRTVSFCTFTSTLLQHLLLSYHHLQWRHHPVASRWQCRLRVRKVQSDS